MNEIILEKYTNQYHMVKITFSNISFKKKKKNKKIQQQICVILWYDKY